MPPLVLKVAVTVRAAFIPRRGAIDERGLGARADPPPEGEAELQGFLDWIDDPAVTGGCPILAACFQLDDREGAPREVLASYLTHFTQAEVQ